MKQPELPRVEDASDEDLRMAIEALGELGQWGGFLRAALAGIHVERQRATVTEVEAARSQGETASQRTYAASDPEPAEGPLRPRE